MKVINKLFDRFRLSVIADPTDDTITLSPALCRHTKVFDMEKAETIVFMTPDKTYNFCFAPDDLPKDTATWPVQYNTQHHTVGFSCPLPTVNRIFYDYGFHTFEPRKLKVTEHRAADLVYYKLSPRHSRPYKFK